MYEQPLLDSAALPFFEPLPRENWPPVLWRKVLLLLVSLGRRMQCSRFEPLLAILKKAATMAQDHQLRLAAVDALAKLLQANVTRRPLGRFSAVWETLIALAAHGGGGGGGGSDLEVRLAALKIVTCLTCTGAFHPQLHLPGQETVTCPVPIAPHLLVSGASSAHVQPNSFSAPSSTASSPHPPSKAELHALWGAGAGAGGSALRGGGALFEEAGAEEAEMEHGYGYVVLERQVLLQVLCDILDKGCHAPGSPELFRVAAEGLEKVCNANRPLMS